MLNQAEATFEWQSVMEALRTIRVEEVQTLLGDVGTVAYTDGACIINPGGPAGWSVLLWSARDCIDGRARDGAARIESYGHIPKAQTTTNNRAEISAVLAALSIAPLDQPLKIYSDSDYTIKVAQGIYQMKANTDLWQLYKTLLKRRKIPPTFEWVRGHAGHEHNERADELAGLGAWNGDRIAYEKWQASQAPEAHNSYSSEEMAALRQQVQKLHTLFEGADVASEMESKFIADMNKRLLKNNFQPTGKQYNWIKVLARKYRL